MLKLLFIDDNPFALSLAHILKKDYEDKCKVIIKTNLSDAEYMLRYDPGINYFDYAIIDVTIGSRHGGWEMVKRLIRDCGLPPEKIVMYSARINEIRDELEQYKEIRILDKTDPNLLEKAISLFIGEQNGK